MYVSSLFDGASRSNVLFEKSKGALNLSAKLGDILSDDAVLPSPRLRRCYLHAANCDFGWRANAPLRSSWRPVPFPEESPFSRVPCHRDSRDWPPSVLNSLFRRRQALGVSVEGAVSDGGVALHRTSCEHSVHIFITIIRIRQSQT